MSKAFFREGALPVEEFAPMGVFSGGGTLFVPELSGPLADDIHARLRARGLPPDIRVRGMIAIPLEARGVVIGC